MESVFALEALNPVAVLGSDAGNPLEGRQIVPREIHALQPWERIRLLVAVRDTVRSRRLARIQVDVGRRHGEGLARVRRSGRGELPASEDSLGRAAHVAQEPAALANRQLVAPRHGECVPLVEVRAAAVEAQVGRIDRSGPTPAAAVVGRGGVVDGLAERVVEAIEQPAAAASTQRSLKGLICRIRAERGVVEAVDAFDRPRERQVAVRAFDGESQVADRLVVVVAALQVTALGGDIADFQRLPAAKVPLDREIPRLQVGRGRVRIKAVDGLDTGPPDPLSSLWIGVLERRRRNVAVARRVVGLVESEREDARQLAPDRTQQIALIEDPVAAPHHVAVVAERSPRKPKPRCEIVEIGINQPPGHADLLREDGAVRQPLVGQDLVQVRQRLVARQHHLVQIGVVGRQAIVHIVGRHLDLVPESEVQRDIAVHLPVVVDEQPEAVTAQFVECRSDPPVHALQAAEEQVTDRMPGKAAPEAVRAAHVVVLRLVVQHAGGIEAHPYRVGLADPRQAPGGLPVPDLLLARRAGALPQGPIALQRDPRQPPQFGSQVVRYGQADGGRIRVRGERIRVVVAVAETARKL